MFVFLLRQQPFSLVHSFHPLDLLPLPATPCRYNSVTLSSLSSSNLAEYELIPGLCAAAQCTGDTSAASVRELIYKVKGNLLEFNSTTFLHAFS